MKKIHLLSVVVFPIFLSAQNPFAKYGYHAPTATSSKGEFEEFHDQQDIVEIGSVRYNVRTKEIIGFINDEQAEKEVSAITTAMSIDPLCEKYYWISPYAYCLNNPVKFIDPDGREVWVIYEDENKKRQQLQYRDGNLYDTKGNLYEGSNEIALTILETLNYLKSLNDGDGFIKEVISVLENSKNKHFIEKNNSDSKPGYVLPYPLHYVDAERGNPTGTRTILSLSEHFVEKDLLGTNETTLGHELRHAYDYEKGKMKGLTHDKRNNTSESPKEIRAVGFENRIRKAMGLPLRTTYGGKKIKAYPNAE